MIHGIDSFFRERRRFARRLSIITLACAVLMLGGMYALQIDTFRRIVGQTPIVRFGYEGRDQLVRRIELKNDTGPTVTQTGLERVPVPATRRGGADESPRTRDRRATPEVRPRRDREGDADTDQAARAARQLMDIPLVRSEELVIEHLVKPSYPEEARERGIEGRVSILALVDTMGQVASVEILNGPETGLLERAATEAVWKCRFRPFVIEGEARSVYAMFRFAFKIY